MPSETGDRGQDAPEPPSFLRTAVLVVHGIGNQRPLETMRAAADAIYTKDPAFDAECGSNEPDLWMTFDRDNVERDIDLPVLTTRDISGGNGPPHFVDFHECYWAHVMSETRFVAVPLLLFDLLRKGPALMRPGIRPLWPAITAAVDLWIAAATFLLLNAGAWLTGTQFGVIVGPSVVWAAAMAVAGFLCGRHGAS